MESEHVVMTPALLRRCRVALGLSQSEMAQALGVQKTTVYRWEHGVAPIGNPERLSREVGALLEARRIEIADIQQEMDAA